MKWDRYRELSKEWRSRSLVYTSAINRFVQRGEAEGWEAVGEQPKDDRGELADAVLAVVDEANRTDAWRELREHFPPAHEPFVARLRECAIGIEDALWIDNAHVVARVGTAWQPEAIVEFGLDGSFAATDATAVGRSPDRRWFAIARENEIEIRDGYRGAIHTRLRVPKSEEPLGMLQPFPDGAEVLMARPDGVFVLGEQGLRALPFDDGSDDDESSSYDMVHAAMSPDGNLVALGHQSSSHVVVTRDGRRLARFGPVHSEYPHHAAFSHDGAYAIFNACHFYNGVTLVASVADLNDLVIEPYKDDARLRVLDGQCRVYVSSLLDNAFVLGDAYGTLRAYTPNGELQWRLFCGSTIGGLDVSPDGSKLAVATAAGYLQLYDLNVPERDPFQIGTARHRERLRFVRWRDRPMLRW